MKSFTSYIIAFRIIEVISNGIKFLALIAAGTRLPVTSVCVQMLYAVWLTTGLI
jgi:hypothetical protein